MISLKETVREKVREGSLVGTSGTTSTKIEFVKQVSFK